MRKLLVCGAMLLLVVILACGGGGLDGNQKETVVTAAAMRVDNESAIVIREVEVMKESAAPAAMATRAPAATATFASVPAQAEGGLRGSSASLQTVQRKIISSASLSLEVEEVDGATAQVRLVAESLGGFVEHLSSSGGPGHQRANMTIRVPQDQFSAALDRIEALGIVLGRNLGSEDVSEQFIDLEARLKSAIREEQKPFKVTGEGLPSQRDSGHREGIGPSQVRDREVSGTAKLPGTAGSPGYYQRVVDPAGRQRWRAAVGSPGCNGIGCYRNRV